ncbi:uncharacterized protein PpBr36_06475 [Pyricularia pennisetigena]|uniref:uncharacterized protein n=1 Tax=Pyricularia pennisetigena TaxID=1578925 RepID=UPI00114EAA2F|nr:uncharacterized protein PpBr36_06475 [Pyricularia pennisetigena]TLS23381.1 hypothetical protein PpBr36_06475 [Pyricularia pennisetigena]
MAASALAKFNSTTDYILQSYPRWQDMDFSKNCTIYGAWLTAYITTYRFVIPVSDKKAVLGPNLQLTPVFVGMALPDNFKLPEGSLRGKTVAEVNVDAELNSWFYANLQRINANGTLVVNEDFLRHTIFEPFDKCTTEYCTAIGFLGNADMTGIGIMISYYIGAGFATAYLIAFSIERYKQARRRHVSRQGMPTRAATFGHKASKRVLEAFHGSFFGYITAAMMLCVSMLAAGIYIAVDKIGENNLPLDERESFFGTASIYDMSLSMASCVFSIFPILVGYCFMRAPEQGQGANHKKWLRRAVLLLIWVLITIELFLSPRGEIDYDDRKIDLKSMTPLDRQEYEATYVCDQRGGKIYWNIVKALQFMVIGLPLIWFVATMFVFKGFAVPRLRDSPTLQRLRKVWHLIPAYVALVLMWASLLFLQWYRQKIRNNSGKLGEESQWGFGQILSLFLWAPTVVEFVYILIWGLEDSLQSHMPPNLQLTVERKPTNFQPGNMDYHPGDETTANNDQPDFEAGGYKMVPVISSRATAAYDTAYSSPMATPQAAPPVEQVAIADGFYAQDMSGNWVMVSKEQAAMLPGCMHVVNGRVVPPVSNTAQT